MENPKDAAPVPAEADRRDRSRGNSFRRSIFGVPVTVTVSIGRQRMSVADLLELREESIIPLTSRIDDPIELTVDNKVIAKGELIEIEDGSLAVKITDIQDQVDG